MGKDGCATVDSFLVNFFPSTNYLIGMKSCGSVYRTNHIITT